MNLYLLVARHRISYDMHDSFLVRATDETAARGLAQAALYSSQSTLHPCTSDSHWSCDALTHEGDEGVILSSFNAG